MGDATQIAFTVCFCWHDPNQRFNPGGRGGFTADVGAATLKTPPGWSSRAVELILCVPG